MAKRRVNLTPKQKRNIIKAFQKNRKAIDKALQQARRKDITLQQARRKIMRSHAALQAWLLRNGGEDPKATEDGRP